jgi:L-fuconolactonase
VDLRADDVERDLERLARSPKLVGIRHLVQDDPDDRLLLDSRFCRGIARLAAFDLAYDILIYPRHLEVAATFVERFPEQRFVLDHVAKPAIRVREIDRWASDLAALAAHPNVFVKLSGLVTEADWKSWTAGDLTPCLDVAMELFGTDRLMIGSDWPVCLLAADYERTLAVVRDHVAPLPEAARRRILGETAAEVYGLTRDREVR